MESIEAFAEKVKKDPFAYRFYENKASETEHTEEKLPLVASYIEKDFNDAVLKLNNYERNEKIKSLLDSFEKKELVYKMDLESLKKYYINNDKLK